MSTEKDNKLKLLFDSLKLSEQQWLKEESLGLTEEDVRNYQLRKETEISMKPNEKRDMVVKEILKPMFKNAGFKCKGMNWWKELEDGYLFIYMKNSRFNSVATGCKFSFQFSASRFDEIRDKIETQYIYNQMKCIEENVFLPHCGYLSAIHDGLDYTIDGYQSYLPKDIPVLIIMNRIRDDFDKYIMPEIEEIKTVSEFEALMEEKKKVLETKEAKLLCFYSHCLMSCSIDSNMPLTLDMLKRIQLSEEEIREHYDWLKIMTAKFYLPHLNAVPYIERALLIAKNQKNR